MFNDFLSQIKEGAQSGEGKGDAKTAGEHETSILRFIERHISEQTKVDNDWKNQMVIIWPPTWQQRYRFMHQISMLL